MVCGFHATFPIRTELLQVGSSWSPYPCSSMRGVPSLMNSPLLLHQSPACLARLVWMFFVMGCW